MVYKRKDRPDEGWRIYITLPKPWGRVGPWQTGIRHKKQAEQIESWLHEMARTRPEVIDWLVGGGRNRLQDAWVAKIRGTLDMLIGGVNDPLLTEAVEAYRPLCKDERAVSGLDQILLYADEGVRLSWLRDKNITRLYAKAMQRPEKPERPRAPNSVRRSLYRAICELLVYHMGEDGRIAAMKGIKAPSEDDTRVVSKTADEIRALLDACVADFRWMVVAAIATAIDRGVLLKMTPRHIKEAEGLVAVPDRKNKNRPRLLRVGGIGLLAFRMAALGKGLDERLWPWTRDQVRDRWDAAREAAKLDNLRFKDLRHLLPTLLAEMGVDRREIQAYMGHAQGSKQTDRYITPTGNPAILDAAAERLGLTNKNLRVG